MPYGILYGIPYCSLRPRNGEKDMPRMGNGAMFRPVASFPVASLPRLWRCVVENRLLQKGHDLNVLTCDDLFEISSVLHGFTVFGGFWCLFPSRFEGQWVRNCFVVPAIVGQL